MKFLVVFSIFSFFLYIFINGLYKDPRKVPSTLINKHTPEFFSEPILEFDSFDRPFLLKEEKVKVINFFASWCAPCEIEHPQLKKLANNKKILVLGINKKDNSDDLKKFLRRLGNPFDAIISDLNGRVGIEWGVYGLPETFIIDKKGKIKYKHIGPIMERDLKLINSIIIKLIDE